jgi:hypothetical protein
LLSSGTSPVPVTTANGCCLTEENSSRLVEQSEEWVTSRRYLDMEKLRGHRRFEECEAEEVMLGET